MESIENGHKIKELFYKNGHTFKNYSVFLMTKCLVETLLD